MGGGGDGWLSHVVVSDRTSGEQRTLPADGLFVMIGAAPHTDWLPRRSSVTDGASWSPVPGSTTPVGPCPGRHCHTSRSVPGLFAVGDVRSDSVKRVASAVGEGSVVVSEVHRYLALSPAPAGR